MVASRQTRGEDSGSSGRSEPENAGGLGALDDICLGPTTEYGDCEGARKGPPASPNETLSVAQEALAEVSARGGSGAVDD